ncbi:hypothetical protein BGZ73_004728 [Actinomortierella ambigua]|nr:hypothetical protein BGZ73_004728 [Actinomortierella ambigua]
MLDIQAIPKEIRVYLTGFDLKRLVLVNRKWWRTFAPFLWERLFINQSNEDQDIILRNGQVVQELTIMVHESESKQRIEWLFETLAKSCPNISVLNLKLQSPLQFDTSSHQPLDTDGSVPQPLEALQVLHRLLSFFPNITTLNLQLAHPDLPAIIVLAAAQLPYLHELGVYGGFKQKTYTLHKNRRCDWDVLFWTMAKCSRLRTLRLAWKDNEHPKQRQPSQVQELQDALQWIGQAEISATQSTPPWVQNHLAQVRRLPLPACVLQQESDNKDCVEEEENTDKARTTTTETATAPQVPPQLGHIRQIHLKDTECPPLKVFKQLMYHCDQLHEFNTETFVHQLDLVGGECTGDVAVTKLCILLEANGPSLRQLDLSNLSTADLMGQRNFHHSYDMDQDYKGICQWERWTSVLQTRFCQGLNRLSIHTPFMYEIQEPSHLRWITHLTAGPINNVASLNRIMAVGNGCPALTHLTLLGSIITSRLGPHWEYNEEQNSWFWVAEVHHDILHVLPWQSQSTLKHVDLAKLSMEHTDEIESLYDVVRTLDKLETLTMPFGHLCALEKLARSLENPDMADRELADITEASLSLENNSATTPMAQKDEEPSSSASATPSHVAIKTQLFPASLHTLRVMCDEDLPSWMPTLPIIKSREHYATVVFDMMPGVRVMQVSQYLTGSFGRRTAAISSVNKDSSDDEQEEDCGDDNDFIPELDQPHNRKIRYQIVSQ